MAAGKCLWVKLRYRTRPSTASPSGQGSDATEIEHDIKTCLAPPLLSKSYLDLGFDLRNFMDMSIDHSIGETAIEHPNPGSLPTPPIVSLTTVDMLAQRKRRKRRKGHHIAKLSLSPPNVPSHDQELMIAEKRRNKLGYHRTSIACSHCRRRKIRCLAAPHDPHNRCANCVRLKKECNFFPVDQQPPIERRSRNPGPKPERGTSNSDQVPFDGHLLDPNPFQALRFSSNGYPASSSWNAGGMVSPRTRASVDHTAPLDFDQATQNHQRWPPPYHELGVMSAGHSSPGDMSYTYWGRHTDSPLTPNYSPHLSTSSIALNQMGTRDSVTSFAPSPRNDSTWSAPARSTSIGVVGDLASTYPKHHSYPQAVSMDFRPQHPDMHPPPLLTTTNSSQHSMSGSNMTPLSAPVSSPPDSWGVAQGWGTLPSSAVTEPTNFGNWYSEAALAKVQEEDVPPHYGAQPAIV